MQLRKARQRLNQNEKCVLVQLANKWLLFDFNRSLPATKLQSSYFLFTSILQFSSSARLFRRRMNGDSLSTYRRTAHRRNTGTGSSVWYVYVNCIAYPTEVMCLSVIDCEQKKRKLKAVQSSYSGMCFRVYFLARLCLSCIIHSFVLSSRLAHQSLLEKVHIYVHTSDRS